MENKRFDLRLKRAIYDIPGRNYGIELLRIVAMIFICVLHVCTRGGVTSHLSASADPDKYRLAWFFEAVTFCCVDIFGMIAGFVGYKKGLRLRRPLELWLELVFYTVLCTLVIYLSAPDKMVENAWFKSVMPVMNGEYWYMTAFFGVLILSPFLNAAVQKMDLKILGISLSLVMLFFSVLPTVMDASVFGLSSGYSTLWLCIMYVSGGFIARIKKPKPIFSAAAFVFFSVICWLLKINGLSSVLKYTSPVVVAAAASILMTFCEIDIKSSKARAVIGFISPSMIGIFILHVHTLIWDLLLKDAAVPFTEDSVFLMGAKILGVAAAIFIGCFAVDLVRRGLFYLLRVNPLLQRLERSVTEIFEKKTVSKETG